MTETAATALDPRHAVALMTYQFLARFAGTTLDAHGNAWGVAVFLDDMWPIATGDLNGRDDMLAAILDLSARTEGAHSIVQTDEFGETRVTLFAGILG